MAARSSDLVHYRDIPLDKRLIWTIPQLCAMCGFNSTFFYKHLPKDRSVTRAEIPFPGGRTVPCFRDITSNQWLVYRAAAERAANSENEGTDHA